MEPAGLEASCGTVILLSRNEVAVTEAQILFCVSVSGDSQMYRLSDSQCTLEIEFLKKMQFFHPRLGTKATYW